MVKKKGFLIPVVLLAVFLLTACGGADEPAPPTEQSQESDSHINHAPDVGSANDGVAQTPLPAFVPPPSIDGEIIYRDSEITILRAPLHGQFDLISQFSDDGIATTVKILGPAGIRVCGHTAGTHLCG